MMKKTLIATALMIATGAASAECVQKMTGEGSGWFWASNITILTDYSTSLGIVHQKREDGSQRYREAAPITKSMLGSQPGSGRFQQAAAVRLLINAAVQCLAPQGTLKNLFFQVSTAINGGATLNNVMIGLKFHDAAQIALGAGGAAMISYSFKF